jgi:3-phenylpropionate/trans-cinnamate dioxygenase ferredoxin reductase subunit
MNTYKYLIIGGGMTADAAVRGIREIDNSGSIGLLCSEASPPYDRPPLSKGLWKGGALESIWRGTDAVAGVKLHLDTVAARLDPAAKRVTDQAGEIYRYEKLLLATGGAPRRLAIGDAHCIYFRTVDDYRKLRSLAASGSRFAVIGGGFIGSEIAAALSINAKRVIMIFPEAGINARMFPADLSRAVTDLYRSKGVEVLTGRSVEGIEPANGRIMVRVQGMEPLTVDGVVAGLGIIPNSGLAAEAGLKVSDGIVVDEFLRTTAGEIYAAGDVARFHNPALGQTIRVEHEDNANTMGRMAGRNMAGASEPYSHLPSFYSDLFELGYEAVGELDPRLETVAKWKDPFHEGIVYYLRDGKVRGVLLWNVWDKVDQARAVIGSQHAVRAGDLDSLIPL